MVKQVKLKLTADVSSSVFRKNVFFKSKCASLTFLILLLCSVSEVHSC